MNKSCQSIILSVYNLYIINSKSVFKILDYKIMKELTSVKIIYTG